MLPTLVRYYLDAFELGAITIAGQPVSIGWYPDPGAHLPASHGVFWTSRARGPNLHRALVARIDAADVPTTDADAAVAALLAVAAERGDPIVIHPEMLQRVRHSLDRIEAMIADMQARGELKAFNRAFRHDRRADGQTPSYRQARANLAMRLIDALAAKSLQTQGNIIHEKTYDDLRN